MAEFTDQEKDKIEQEIHAKFLLETQLKIFNIACDSQDTQKIHEILDTNPEIKITGDLLMSICEKGKEKTFQAILSRRYGEIKENITDAHLMTASLRGHLNLFALLLQFIDPAINKKSKINHHFLYHISRTKKECKIYQEAIPATLKMLPANERYMNKDDDSNPTPNNDSNTPNNSNTPNDSNPKPTNDSNNYNKILCEKEMVNITNYLPKLDEDYYIYKVKIFTESRMITNEYKRHWISTKYQLYDEDKFRVATKNEWVSTISKYYRRYFLGDKSDNLQKKWIQFEKDEGYQTEQLRTDGLMIEWLPNPTLEQCRVAVEHTGYAVCMIPEDKKDQLEEFIGTQSNRTKYHYRNGMDFTRHKQLFHTKFIDSNQDEE